MVFEGEKSLQQDSMPSRKSSDDDEKSDAKTKKKVKELDPTQPCFYPSKPFTPTSSRPGSKSSPELKKMSKSNSVSDLASAFSQLSPNDSGLGCLGDNESGSDSCGGSPVVSRYGSSIASWDGEAINRMRGSQNQRYSNDFTDSDHGYSSPAIMSRSSRKKALQRKCSTPARLDDVSGTSGQSLQFTSAEAGGKSVQERPKSANQMSRCVEEIPDMDDLVVIGLEVPLITGGKDKKSGGGGNGSGGSGSVGGGAEYYWFPYRQEYKLKRLESEPKHKELFNQLSHRVEYDERPLNVFATIDGHGNFSYVMHDNDWSNVKGKPLLVEIYKVKY